VYFQKWDKNSGNNCSILDASFVSCISRPQSTKLFGNNCSVCNLQHLWLVKVAKVAQKLGNNCSVSKHDGLPGELRLKSTNLFGNNCSECNLQHLWPKKVAKVTPKVREQLQCFKTRRFARRFAATVDEFVREQLQCFLDGTCELKKTAKWSILFGNKCSISHYLQYFN